MNTANISYTRNHLSELIARVREGETVLIMDRNQPVARLEPVKHAEQTSPTWKTPLVQRGIICPARQRLDPATFRALPLARPEKGGDVLKALLANREEDR